jgi:hypothetical protein
MTTVYEYNASVTTDNLETFSMDHNQHLPSNMCVRWSSTYDYNGTQYNLGTTKSCLGALTSTMLDLLNSFNNNVYLYNSTMAGVFTITWADKSEKCQVEMKNHSYHFTGTDFDKWGGNYLNLYTEYITSLGATDFTVIHDPYTVSVVTVGGANNNSSSTKTSGNKSDVKPQEKPKPKPKPKEPSEEEDDSMFDLFG